MVGILFQPPCLDIKVLALLLRLLELLSKIDSCPLQDVAKYSINFFLLSFADPSGVDYCWTVRIHQIYLQSQPNPNQNTCVNGLSFSVDFRSSPTCHAAYRPAQSVLNLITDRILARIRTTYPLSVFKCLRFKYFFFFFFTAKFIDLKIFPPLLDSWKTRIGIRRKITGSRFSRLSQHAALPEVQEDSAHACHQLQ